MNVQDSNVIFPEIPRDEDFDVTAHESPYRNPGMPGTKGKYPTSALEAQIIPSAESPDGPSWSKNYMQD